MKYLSLLLLTLLLACKSAQTDLPLLQSCPESGICDVQVLKQTKLNIVEEASKVVGTSFEEDVNFQVILIRYRDLDELNYTEEIYLQIPSRFKDITSKNHSLQNQKLLVNRQCDCDSEGFEKILKGELELTNLKDYILLHLEIKSDKNYIANDIDLHI
jgi:hypothetical protein